MRNKVFFGFLVGLVASVFVLSALIVYFLRPVGSDVTSAPPVRPGTVRQIKINGKMLVPPPLRGFTKKKGVQILRITNLNFLIGNPLASVEISGTEFLKEFSVDLNFDRQFIQPVAPFPQGKKVFLFAQVLYCFGALDRSLPINQQCSPADADVLVAGNPMWVGSDEIERGATITPRPFPVTVHNVHSQKADCLGSNSFLSGTILPTSAFLARAPKDKVAVLSFYSFPEAVPGVDGQPLPMHVQEIQISPKGTKFSIPMPKKVSRKSVHGYVRLCNRGTPPLECLADLEDISALFSPTQEKNLQFRLIGDGLRRPFCGEKNRTMHLHWYKPFDPKRNPKLGREEDPSLPAEIIEPSS